MGDTNGTRVPQIFVPLVRPHLKETPSQSEAAAFLKSYERYVQEAAHLRRNNEGDGTETADPLSFCIEPTLLEFLVEYEMGEIEVDDEGVATDASLLRWLQEIRGADDGRRLEDVMRGIRWPTVVAGQTLQHQTMVFMRTCHTALVVETGALNRFGDKAIISKLVPKLPRMLREETTDFLNIVVLGMARYIAIYRNILKYYQKI